MNIFFYPIYPVNPDTYFKTIIAASIENGYKMMEKKINVIIIIPYFVKKIGDLLCQEVTSLGGNGY